MVLKLFSAVILAAGLSCAAAAQDLPDDVGEAYVAYTQAIEAGDYAAAAASARTAWCAAERGEVDPETTAILADNYAQLASALGEHVDAGEAYEAAAELLTEAGAAGDMVADTWILAANAALNAGENRLAMRHADAAGDLAESLTGIDPARRAGMVFLSRSVHANALWLDGRPLGAGMRAREAMAAAEAEGLAPNARYGLTAFILGAAHAIELEYDEAAFRLTQAVHHMDSERQGLSVWAQYVRSQLNAEERLELLARLEAEGLIEQGEAGDIDDAAQDERPEGWVDASPRRRQPPDYPSDAERVGAEGVALIEFAIDERGRTTDVEVVIAAPYAVFGSASVEAIERWRYDPATVNGEAVRRHGMLTQIEYVMAD